MEQKTKVELKVQSLDLLVTRGYYLDCMKIYYAYFEEIPNIVSVQGIDFEPLKKWLEKKFSKRMLKKHTRESFDISSKNPIQKNILYILKDKILIDIEGSSVSILYTEESVESVKDLVNEFKVFKIKYKKKREPGFLHYNCD